MNQHIINNNNDHYITATEAVNLLGIKKATLYSYVSRNKKKNKIKTIDSPINKKKKLYSFNDIIALVEKKKAESAELISKESLNWGKPVLETKISHIENSMLYYKSYSIEFLVKKKYNFEQVASYLWTGEFNKENLFFYDTNIQHESLNYNRNDIQIFLAELDKKDLGVRLEQNIPLLGSKIIQIIVNGITNNYTSEEIHIKLATFFCPENKKAQDLIKIALIIIADHELNASSFTARVVASTKANLYQILIAGLSALSGYKHGSNTYKVAEMFDDLSKNFLFKENLRRRLDRGDELVGFGHKLYANGDPRAEILLKAIEKVLSQDKKYYKKYEVVKAIKWHCTDLLKEKPNIDFALYSLAYLLDKPADFSFFLFMLGRMAGWIAHAIEEYSRNELIRPRADYKGPEPIR